jgi:UDP-glucose 4-epimerase
MSDTFQRTGRDPGSMKVLICGGAGFIGSTIASACLDGGITPVILDNLSTGRAEFTGDRIFYRGDIADGRLLTRIFAEHPDIEVTVHCAGLIVAPDSVADPLRYYRENVTKSVELVGHLIANGCRRLVFSSSASIYQPGEDFGVDEASPIAPSSPYSWSKAMVEQVLRDSCAAYQVRVISLRYFNPIGADPAMRTGPAVREPSHVLGKLVRAARTGKPFCITGTDWPTSDGSGIRDYIHVWDLAQAHVRALRRFDEILPPRGPGRFLAVNLGTGVGTTVRQFLVAFEKVLGRSLPVREMPRRPGDLAGGFNRSLLHRDLLRWQPVLSVEDGIKHTLQWFATRDELLWLGPTEAGRAASTKFPSERW